MTVTIDRRMGTTPAQRGSITGETCPDVLRLTDGRYLIIGKIPMEPHLLDDLGEHAASIGADELPVIIPADCMHAAARDIMQHITAGQP